MTTTTTTADAEWAARRIVRDRRRPHCSCHLAGVFCGYHQFGMITTEPVYADYHAAYLYGAIEARGTFDTESVHDLPDRVWDDARDYALRMVRP